MSALTDKLAETFQFRDTLRLWLLEHAQQGVTTKDISERFGISDRQARSYMTALQCENIGTHHQPRYRYTPDETLQKLAQAICTE